MDSRDVFARLPMPIQPGDHVDLGEHWGLGVVQTAKVADDLRDAKCVVRLDEEPEDDDRADDHG